VHDFLFVMDAKPMLKGPTERDSTREIYISFSDFNSVAENLPLWAQPIIQTLYLTGVRCGEVFRLT
jgi:hypothetical protein